MHTQLTATREAFTRYFGHEPTLYAYAPGRVNLIGEHTDYNGGFVLPCAIKYGTVIWACPNGCSTLKVLAYDLAEDNYDEISLSKAPEKSPRLLWSNYLRGMLRELGLKYPLAGKGYDLLISGDIPKGAGLSSSASLEVCFGALISRAFSLEGELQELARCGQAAEAFVGIKCGIMDQTISACGKEGCALLLDCLSQKLTQVPLPEGLTVMVINSNVKHQLVGSEYNERRESCERAAGVLGVSLLREADESRLEAVRDRLDEVTYRRARHVITENERVLQAVEALKKGDLTRLSSLMYASHCSMRDDFAITIPEIDALVEIVRDTLGAERGAVRMTGGGFGGSVVVLLSPDRVEAVREAVAARYPLVAHRQATLFETPACQGVEVRSL